MTTDTSQINMANLFDDLATALGIEEMPDQEREELIAMMGETVLHNALARFIDMSDEITVTALTQKMESMELLAFLASVDETYPDFGYILNDETRLFLEELQNIEMPE